MLNKNGTKVHTGDLDVILDGLSVNIRKFPRRRGNASSNGSAVDGAGPSRAAWVVVIFFLSDKDLYNIVCRLRNGHYRSLNNFLEEKLCFL